MHPLKCFLPLLPDLCCCFSRCSYSPHLVECVHVERKVEQFSVEICYRGIGVPVELHQRIQKIPYILVGSMENMRSVFVDIDAFRTAAVNVTAGVGAFFYHKASFPFHAGPVGECGPEQSGPYYKIIVLHKVFQRLSSKSGPEISLSDCVFYLSACRTFFSCVRSV